MNEKLDPAEFVGKWLRDKGKECADLKKRVEELEAKNAELNEKRQKQVAVMQELAIVLNLKFPDPKRIVEEVRKLRPCGEV